LDELTKETDIRGIKADLSSSEVIRKIVADQDIVIGAVPGFLRFNMLRSVIEAGKNIVDISFMAEDTLSLDALKVELIYPKKYETRIEAQRDIFEYIEVFYNRERLHSFLGYNSPEEYEKMTMVA
jgi:transposase InsO family protein